MNVAVTWAIRLLELLFVIGSFGSLIVILLAGIEDIETIFSRGDEERVAQPASPAKL